MKAIRPNTEVALRRKNSASRPKLEVLSEFLACYPDMDTDKDIGIEISIDIDI